MPGNFRPSVCVDAVFSEIPTCDAIKMVRDVGIGAFEFWGWWDKDLDAINAARDETNLRVSACCTKFISLVDPATRGDYLKGLEESIAAAEQLDCPTLISQVGDFRVGVSREEQHNCLVDGLREAAPMLEESNVTLVIEPLNELIDHAGYYLVRSDEAFHIVDKVASDRVRIVFDIYHQQISEGQLIHNITNNIDRIAHFHAAGNPGRNELTRGELHYPSIFDAIARTDFNGYVGLEYWPIDRPELGLREVNSWFERTLV